MHKGKMDVKVYFIIAMICIAITSKHYLHNCGSTSNNRQKVNGTNALIYFREGAVE